MGLEEVKYGYDNYGFRVEGTDTLIDGNLKVTGKIKGGNDMMGLYEVNVVDTKKNEEVAENIRVIAKDEDGAKMMALEEIGKTLDINRVVFFVRCIGTWESKKPKEVKIVQ